MAKHMHGINLLPSSADTLLVQFLTWALSVGRLLIIIVETLALGTFLYRFTIDWKIIDLKDKIKVQRAIVTSYATQEDIFRNLQIRLDLVKKYDSSSKDNPTLLTDIIEMGRGYVTFKSIHITSASIKIEAEASTVAPLTAFVKEMKGYSKVKGISIDKVENKTSSAQITVGLSADLKNDDPSEELEPEALVDKPFADKD